MVKQSLLLLVVGLLVTGCASSSIESRRRERASAYAALNPELKTLVDQGEVRRGMPQDAVYIAWGKPSQVLHQEDQRGLVTFWLYHGGWLEETRYWAPYTRMPITDYQPRTYVSAEVTFVNGLVDAWRMLPKPAY
jgi:hypothetical protein